MLHTQKIELYSLVMNVTHYKILKSFVEILTSYMKRDGLSKTFKSFLKFLRNQTKRKTYLNNIYYRNMQVFSLLSDVFRLVHLMGDHRAPL